MKIRTDFVTNSSSSSFVATLDITLDNGESLRFAASSSNGGEEGGFIVEPEAHYKVDPYDLNGSILDAALTDGLQGLQKKLDKIINHIDAVSYQSCNHRTSKSDVRHLFAKEKEAFFNGAKSITSGVLTIQVHTYGEYYNEADPRRLLTDYSIFGLPYGAEDQSYSDLYQTICDDPSSEMYTEDTLERIAETVTASWDDHGSDTQIIQTLENGKIDIEIDTGDGIVPVEEAYVFNKHNEECGNDDLKYDFPARMKRYGLENIDYTERAKRLFEGYMQWASGSGEIVYSGKKFCLLGYKPTHAYEELINYFGGSCTYQFDPGADYVILTHEFKQDASAHEQDAMYEYIDVHYDELSDRLMACKEHGIKILLFEKFDKEYDRLTKEINNKLYYELYDEKTLISIQGKHFVFDRVYWDEKWVVDRTAELGGIIHRSPVNNVDYYVVGNGYTGVLGYSPNMKKMIELQKVGSNAQFIPIDVLIQVLHDDKLREENERQATMEREKELEEARRLAEENQMHREEERRLQAEERQRLRAEEKQRKAERNRIMQEEARRIQAEEKRKQFELAKQQKERLAEEEKAMRERQRAEALANATILYTPGEEPDNLRKRLDTLFAKLNGAYPDHRISRLNQDHKRWGETVTELYRILGYPDGQAFLEAYGYTVEKSVGGRKVSVDPIASMEELHRRYPDGGAESMDALKKDNPDIPWKTLANNAREYFGATLVAYLKQIGILGKSGIKETSMNPNTDVMTEVINIKEKFEPLLASDVTVLSLPVERVEIDEDSWIQAIAAETSLQDEEILYLRTIHQLFQSAGTVRMIDVAKCLQQGTGKVSYWMKKLREKGILETTPKGVITMLKP